MRRSFGLLVLFFFALPLGFSVVGCGHKTVVQYCNGEGYGPTAGQVKTITLSQALIATGESLNYGQIGTPLGATAEDCLGGTVSVSHYIYATSDMSIADINPSNGAVCGGSWNRNTGGGIADYTVCTPPVNPINHTALITASASGATSNPIEVFIHPTVTGIVLGDASTNCPATSSSTANTDPASNCSACNPNLNGVNLNPAAAYNGNSCLSQYSGAPNHIGQLVARVYTNGTTNPADNITCQVGPLAFALQGSANVATINATGLATANQPGSSLITATVSNSSSAVNAGYISTCPPASIVLSAVNQPANASNINVSLNTPQAFTASVLDTQGYPINGLALDFNSTLPVNFPTASSTVTPAFPGSATITASCQPPICNTAPFSQIGYLGNGKPVTSNGITVTAAGSVSTVLYMGSTSSQYLASEDFTTGQLGSPVKLPYTPNSMVIAQDGSTIYMGSVGGMMVVSTSSGAIAGTFQTVQGSVLTVSPNDTYVVITDPSRGTVSLVTSSGAVFSSFNAIGTHAEWTPDSSTLYVTTNTNQLLTYSTFVGWESTPIDEAQYSDVAVTVPNYGAYFAGPITEGRSYCASTTVASNGTPPATSNVFTPLVDQITSPTERLAATTDGKHVLGATAQTTPATLEDFLPTPPTQTVNGTVTLAPCPAPPNVVGPGYFSASVTPHVLNGIAATAITAVVPASNSTVATVTYTGSGGILPLYAPATGTLTNVPLSGGASTAPVAGVFSTDNSTFYAGTSGDNVVHIITFSGTTGTDTGVIAPKLPDANGNIATPNLIVQRARKAQA